MKCVILVRRAIAVSAAALVSVTAACRDTTPTGVANSAAPTSAKSLLMLSAADVVVPGADGGAFTNAIVADNSGYATTEFWDNASSDGAGCNSGFYASGTLALPCTDAASGSNANAGGYTKYWGDGEGNRGASSFMFKGNVGYVVKLEGSYAGENSEIGWFTKSGTTYTFHAVAGWGTKSVGTTAFIRPDAGADWGLYIKHEGRTTPGCNPGYDCSDATGDIHGGEPPVQQFALFTNADESKYLVGIEDNDQDVAGVGDDDFNDFLLSVVPVGGPFVIGDMANHSVGSVVNFWGAQWKQNNPMSGAVSNAANSFKGYATQSTFACGGTWTGATGNSAPPPASIPEYVAIVVTSLLNKSGSVFDGNIREILIVKQDGGYAPAPGHRGNGEVMSTVCGSPQ